MTSSARLGLLGGECTGKSALAAALAGRLDGCVVEEVLREFVSAQGRAPAAQEQSAILGAQMAREDAVAAACAGPTIADPAPLMTAVYSVAYFADTSLLPKAVEHARAYRLLVWCDQDLTWQPDEGQRDGPEYRARVHEVIADVVEEWLHPRGIQVLLVHGSLDERVAAVLGAWQPGPQGRPT